jgi:hypothetical protein
MNKQSKKIAFVLLVILIGAAACNFPSQTPPKSALPTPDLTITALFSFISTAQAAQTSTAVPPVVVQASPTVTAPVVAVATTVPTTASTQAPTATFTNTPAPTATDRPSSGSSISGPSRRSGPTVVAHYLQREPTIDGVFDEAIWGDLNRYDISSVVFGGKEWDGDDDLSGNVMIAWDDYFLYIAARVRDDDYVQSASGKNIFKGDSIEILLDINVPKDFHDDGLSNDDYQIGISPGQDEPSDDIENYVWYPKSKEGEYGTIKAAATATDDGYRIEAKIPWEIFGIKPDIGKHFGLAFSISDNDQDGENVQESMVSNVDGRRLTDPTTWGDLLLEGRP